VTSHSGVYSIAGAFCVVQAVATGRSYRVSLYLVGVEEVAKSQKFGASPAKFRDTR
jgi:hypothetical protein